MDAAPESPEPGPALPVLLVAPQAEVLEEVLREQFGPLPQVAAICRLKRLTSGGYSSTEDLHLVLERRRVANAKERERVRGPQGHPARPATPPLVGTTKHLVAPRRTRGPLGDFELLKPAGVPSLWENDSGLVTYSPHASSCSFTVSGIAVSCLALQTCAGTKLRSRRSEPLTTSRMSPPPQVF
jgi:hypothetical protein